MKLTCRQQLHADDNQILAGLLDMNVAVQPTQKAEVKKYDVFVFELCEGNISKENINGSYGQTLGLSDSVSICDQLLEGLIQLEKSKCCHNDLKPENVLFNYNGNFEIRISDFGKADRSGGTPGWTWPKFLTERKPGKSDVYSVALLMLYTMCEDREVFYRIRNNYVQNCGQKWLTDFRNDPFMMLVNDMMDLKVTPRETKNRWNQISGQVQVITKDYLRRNYGVDDRWLRVQDEMDVHQLKLASLSVLDR